jgi:L-fuconate dehydratase
VTEYVDHLHEHFADPCIVEAGAYRLPTAPGYSAEMLASSVEEFRFPDGLYWAGDGTGSSSSTNTSIASR